MAALYADALPWCLARHRCETTTTFARLLPSKVWQCKILRKGGNQTAGGHQWHRKLGSNNRILLGIATPLRKCAPKWTACSKILSGAAFSALRHSRKLLS